MKPDSWGGVTPAIVVPVCTKPDPKEYGLKGLRLHLVEVIEAVPLGQGVANSNASWMQAATGSQMAGWGLGRVKCGIEGGRGHLAGLTQGRPPRLAQHTEGLRGGGPMWPELAKKYFFSNMKPIPFPWKISRLVNVGNLFRVL